MSGIDPRAVLKDWLDPPRKGGQWCRFCEDWEHSSQDTREELCPIEALAAEIQAHEETRRALRQYAQHRIGCAWDRGGCDCGLDKALAAPEEI